MFLRVPVWRYALFPFVVAAQPESRFSCMLPYFCKQYPNRRNDLKECQGA